MERGLRRLGVVLIALLALAVPMVAGAQDRGPAPGPCQLVSVGNDYLTVWAWQHTDVATRGAECNIGVYGVVTGPLHPSGAGLDVLHDGANPSTSFNSIASFTSGNEYVLADGGTLDGVDPGVYLLSSSAETEVIDASELEMTFSTEGLDVSDNLRVTVTVEVTGTSLDDSKVRVATRVSNANTSSAERGDGQSVRVGIRHLWDFALSVVSGGSEDGPVFQHFPSFNTYTSEQPFSAASVPTVYDMYANDGLVPYWATGSGTDLVADPGSDRAAQRGLAINEPPTSLDYVCAPRAADDAFFYTVNGDIVVASEDAACSPSATGDSGVAYYWADEPPDAERGAPGILIGPGSSYLVDSYLWTYGYPPPPPPVFCLTLELDATQVAASLLGIPGLQNNDVVCSEDALEGTQTSGRVSRGEGEGEFEMFFDGSDVGITRTIIDGMDILEEPSDSPPIPVSRGVEQSMDVLLSFNIAHSIPPIGLVLQADIVRFVAQENGSNTDGEFERFFDGSDIGLQSAGEDVDAFYFEEYFRPTEARGEPPGSIGNLYFSTKGNVSIPGLTAQDEDIIVCWGYGFTLQPGGDINSSCAEMEVFFDGTAAGLGDAATEDVDAFAFESNLRRGAGGRPLYLSTRGNFSVEGVSGRNEDVFRCVPGSQPASRGLSLPLTSCESVDIVFDGSDYILGSNNVFSLDLLAPPCILDAARGPGICPE